MKLGLVAKIWVAGYLIGEKGYAQYVSADSKRFDALFQKYGTQYGVDWQWLKAIAMNESNLGQAESVKLGMLYPTNIEESKSSDGKSWGLMQVTLTTAKKLDPSATEEKLNNPEYSIKLAAQLIASDMKLFARADSRYTEWVIKSYNQGATHTRNESVGKISNPQWHDHVQEYWERWKRNYGKVLNGY